MARRRPENSSQGLIVWLRRSWQSTGTLFRADPESTRPQTSELIAGIEAQLRENERIWARFSQLELEMLHAVSLEEVLDTLINRLPRAFPAVKAVSLAWLENDHALLREIERSMQNRPGGQAIVPWSGLLPLDAAGRSRLGPISPELQQRLFPRVTEPLGSVAVVPLRLHGNVIGSFNQASDDPRHFTHDSSTDLVEHLASVAALCIENAVNRERLQRESLTDALTGAPNRRFFERRLLEEISNWRRHGASVSCLLVDIDYFKQINDRHGHPAGDRVLQQVAARLNDGLRTSDVLARFGGEEFVLLLPATEITLAGEIAERLRATIAGDVLRLQSSQQIRVTVSIGVASLDARQRQAPPDLPAKQLLQAADEALYRAKEEGRNCVRSAAPSYP